MSDHWITLVPADPYFVPDAESRNEALSRYRSILPKAEKLSANVYDDVQFFDCGENCERILCPNCRREIAVEWWGQHMDRDRFEDRGFKLEAYAMPCCAREFTLNELIYDWPQRFGRFSLDAMNPDVGMLLDEQRVELEAILGTPLCIIYQHI